MHPPEPKKARRDASGSASKETVLETVEPVGKRVVIRKDDDKKQTRSGIHLPDKIEIPTLTGRIVAISAQIERDLDYPIRTYDRVLFNPKHAIPVDLEGDNRLYVVPLEDVVAIFRRDGGPAAPGEASSGGGSNRG
ncbi:MAG: co-chaperone GroES [Planctomycetota bacterium]|nr:co-chaperone GroES [Planctomycetota bacterium]